MSERASETPESTLDRAATHVVSDHYEWSGAAVRVVLCPDATAKAHEAAKKEEAGAARNGGLASTEQAFSASCTQSVAWPRTPWLT